MIVVIIAGGSGSRLWPLSTPSFPKHLLKLTGDKSLLQNTVDRAKLVSDKIFIVSEASHIEEVYRQIPLPQDHIIVEPARRGTASCIITALARIKGMYDTDEPIAFMHGDSHIRDTDTFATTLRQAAQLSERYRRLILLGLEPTFPATGFGYIERGQRVDDNPPAFTIQSFKEKPDHATAEAYFTTGNYLWNMGYFVAPLQVFESTFQQYAPHLAENYQKLVDAKTPEEHDQYYLGFEAEPIELALIEKVDNFLVTPGTFDWMDLGSYPDVHQVNRQDERGNTVQGLAEVESVTNSFIRNDSELPVAVIGLDNVAVVVTENGVLVTNKNYAQRVGDVSKKFKQD